MSVSTEATPKVPTTVSNLQKGETVVVSNHTSTGLCEKQYDQNGTYQKNGEMKYWYDNGSLRLRAHYVDGVEHGVQEMWGENGRKVWERNFDNGIGHGLFIDYKPNGDIHRKREFSFGRCLTDEFPNHNKTKDWNTSSEKKNPDALEYFEKLADKANGVDETLVSKIVEMVMVKVKEELIKS